MRRIVLLLSLFCSALASPLQGMERVAVPAEKPAGSGVIVHSDGYILTAHHVVANAKRIVVVTAGEFRAPAILVSVDAEHDLALLKIETVGLTEAPIGYAGSVRLDQEIVTVGFPFGLKDVSVTRGRIAAVRTKGVQRVFQVDAAINPGNSGGALFTRHGEVIGVLTTKFTHPSGIVPEGMAFAVPISYATPLLANIPDFDFTAIGKSRKHSKAASKEVLAEDLTRTTVRIETMRMADQSAALPAAAPVNQPPPAHGQPVPVDRSGPTDDPNVSKVNEQLRAAQQEETGRLSQRGAAVPDGMLLIPGGEFVMGAEDLAPDARPMHRVMVGSFWLDRYKVTNGEYRRCVDGGGCLPPKDRRAFDDAERLHHPVVNVTWTQARNYCHWKGKRLPTEAEWEKAARGTDARRYPWGNTTDPSLHRPKNGETGTSVNGTEPVGSRPANVSPYGIFDMVGSVSEWVKDWYAEDFYQVSPAHDPQGPVRGSFRVLRGGELSERPLEHHVSIRSWDEMTYWGPTLGIRCALDAS